MRYVFSAEAGPYAGLAPSSKEALGRLADRVDAIEGKEQQGWQATQLKDLDGSEPQQKQLSTVRHILCVRQLRPAVSTSIAGDGGH